MLEGGTEVINLVSRYLQAADFTHPLSKNLVEMLLRRVEGGTSIDPAVLVNEIEDDTQRRFIAQVMFSKYNLSKGWDEAGIQIEKADPSKIALDAIMLIRHRSLEKTVEDNQRLLRDASQNGEDVMPFLKRHQQLLADIKELELKGLQDM
jgi:hypothetical protein